MGERTKGLLKVKCTDCDKWYIGQTRKKSVTRMYENKCTTKRHDLLFLISIHKEQKHKFKPDGVEILDQATTRHTRELLKA